MLCCKMVSSCDDAPDIGFPSVELETSMVEPSEEEGSDIDTEAPSILDKL